MSSVIIFEKDLKKLGRLIMHDFYYSIHEEYFLKEFEEIRLKKKYYDDNFSKEYLSFCKDEERKDGFSHVHFNNKKLEDLIEMDTEELLLNLKNKIDHEDLDYNLIYRFLTKMKREVNIDKQIDFEIDEDLFCSIKSFINLYNVYHYDYKELP